MPRRFLSVCLTYRHRIATAGAWTYSQPEYDVELEMKGMLCISGEIGGDANEPAYAPDLGEELNVDLE
jgi:hypothetical protein